MAGRKTTTAAENIGPDFVGATPVDMAAQESRVNQALELAGGMAEERDLMNQLLGQAQMADAFAKFSATVAVSKLLYVKENKLYRALAGMKGRDGRGFDGTWEEFCKLLGTSAPKVNEDINNLQSFGEQALDSMSRMGIGYRELRQYRRLPEDQKTALIEVAKAGDKEAFLDLAEEMIAKHSREKEDLAKQVADTQADLEASRNRLAEREEEVQKTKSQIIKLTAGTLPWDERTAEFRKGIVERRTPMVEAIADTEESIRVLDQWLTDHITSQPGYDPEAPVKLPKEVGSLLIQLNETIETAAFMVARAQYELNAKFGAELQEAHQYLLQANEGA